MPFGKQACTKAKLAVTVQRVPAVVDGSNFKTKVRVTKVGAPDDGKISGDSTRCETPLTVKNLAPGTYRVTVVPDLDDHYYFADADAVTIVLVAAVAAVPVTVNIRPLSIATITPDAAWRQYVNLELTDDARTAGNALVTHDVQQVRAAAALVAANTSGIQEWIDVATQMVAAAPGKAMNPKQLGRVLEVEATLAQPVAGVKVYFGFVAAGTNPAWAGAKAELRAGLTHKPAGAKDKWETTFKKEFALTDALGKAKARLQVSRFGGDQFTVKASLHKEPLTNGKTRDTALITTWRKIWYQLTWNREHPTYSLALATADFERAFVEFEAIDPRPFTPPPGVFENAFWHFDEGPMRGGLAPGQTARVEFVIDTTFAGALPELGQFVATPTVNNVPGTAIRRNITLLNPAVLEVTGADYTPAAAAVGSAFAALTATYTVKNIGHTTLAFEVAKTQPWVTLSVVSGRLAHNATASVVVTLDAARLAGLLPGTYTDTLTFTHPGVPAETVTRTVTVTVTASVPAALTVSDHEGITLLGAAGGPFTGSDSKTWTLTNQGGAALEFTLTRPAPAWIELTCPAVEAIAQASVQATETARLAEEAAVAREGEATVLDNELSAQVNREGDAVRDADTRTQKATEAATKARQAATQARERATRLDSERQPLVEEHATAQSRATTAREEATQARLRASQVLARATTSEMRAQAETESERADAAEMRAGRVEERARDALRRRDDAQHSWTNADAEAGQRETAATEADDRAREATERGEREKLEASTATGEVRGRTELKRQEATVARDEANLRKQEAVTAKDLADRGVGKLAIGATTTVTARVKTNHATVLGALPLRTTLVFHGPRDVERVVEVVRPGDMTIAGADIAKTRAAGVFDATSQAYTLTNNGDVAVEFTAVSSVPWVTVDVAAGTLRPGAPVTVTATVNLAAANTFEVGPHAGQVTFTDVGHAVTVQKQVTLTVTANPQPVLAVLPWEPLECLGQPGPPFAPGTRIYTLKNIGGALLNYRVTRAVTTGDWLRMSTPGNTVAIGDHNKHLLWPLRQQPPNERPSTVQLLICQKQTDPEDTDSLNVTSDSCVVTFTGAGVVNSDGDRIEVVNPSVDRLAVIVAGDWSWDGHGGTLVGHDDWLTIPRERANLSTFNLTIPPTCAGCAKPGCVAGDAIAPTALDPLQINGLELHGFRSYLGEGGYEDRPTCLIVAKLNQVDDFNDTVSHEIGHMMNAVLHKKADQQKAIAEAKTNVKDLNKELRKLTVGTAQHTEFQGYARSWTARVASQEKELPYFWPPGVPVHPIQYDEGQGNHCGEGGTVVPPVNPGEPTTYDDGSCILYASGRDVKLVWCNNCLNYFRFTDLRRFLWR